MKVMKVEEGTDNLQEIYIVLSGKLCKKFYYVKERRCYFKRPKKFSGFLTRRKCNRLFWTKKYLANLAFLLVVLVGPIILSRCILSSVFAFEKVFAVA